MSSRDHHPLDHRGAADNGAYGRRQFLHFVAGGALAAGIGTASSCAPTSDAPTSDALTSDASGVGIGGNEGRGGAGGNEGRGGAGGVGIGGNEGDGSGGGENSAGGGRRAASINGDRTLVVVELQGGNDGLDTVIPYADPAYLGLRPTIGVAPEEVLALDDEVGLNPALARLHDRTVASIEGVGLVSPSFSHSDCARRWSHGEARNGDRFPTGFLGRLCDQLDIGAPATGVSLSHMPTTALLSEKARTAALPSPNDGGWIHDQDPWNVAAVAGLRAMANPTASKAFSPPLLDRAGAAIGEVFDLNDAIRALPDKSDDYEWGALSRRLATASQLIRSDLGVRVIHVPFGGFDTHDEHRWRHDDLLGELDIAVDTFLADMEKHGRADSVLVATVSEFGRRPAENRGGTDHGSASVALLAGPVVSGRYGEQPSLTDLVDDNLRHNVHVSDYYATLAESWFGIPASDVLGQGATPIAGVFSA